MAERGESIGLDIFDQGGDTNAAQDEFADTSFSYFEEVDPQLSGRAPGEGLPQQRTFITDLTVDKYMRQMKLTDADVKDARQLNAKIKDDELYYNELKLTYDRGRKAYAVSTLKNRRGGRAFVEDILGAAAAPSTARKADVLNLRVSPASYSKSML